MTTDGRVDRPARLTLRALAQDSVVYSLGSVVSGALGLAALPILTRILPPTAYGAAETVVAYATTISALVVLGLDSAAGRYFFDDDDEARRRTVVSTGFWALVGSGTLAGVVLAVLATPLADRALGQSWLATALLGAALGVPAATVDGYLRHTLRWRRARGRYLASQLTLSIGRFALTIALARLLGVLGVAIAWSLSLLASVAFTLPLARGAVRLAFSRELLPRFLAYGIPLAALGVAGPLAMLSDRFFLLRFRAPEELGHYSAALRLAAAYTLASEGFRQAWGPLAFSRWNEPDFARSFGRVVGVFLVGSTAIALACAGLGSAVLRVVASPAYASAGPVVGLLVLGGVAQDLWSLGGVGIFRARSTRWFVVAAAASLMVTVALDVALVPRLGVRGAAAASVAGRLAGAAVVVTISQRLLAVRYGRAALAAAALLAALTVLLGLIGT